MRLAQIVPSLEARHGGPSRSVRALSAGLAVAGDAVELLTTEPGASAVEQAGSQLTIHRFPRQRPRAFCPSTPLHEHLDRTPFDVIHYHSLWLRPLHYAATASRRSGTPLVIAPRGMMSPWAWQHHRWKKILADKLLHPGALRDAAGWQATSVAEADDIRRLGFTQPVCVSPNGVVLPDPAALESARHFWLARCPALAGRRVALFYSRFHAKKRVLELISLWASLAPRDWVLLVVGIPEQYGVDALRAHARQCGAGVEIHDGTDTPPPYAVAELYLLPTHSENFGLTLAEAMAAGLPVVTTDGAPWHDLENNHAGRCVPWAQFTPALRALLAESPEALRARGNVGREWMRRDFSWSAAAALLRAFYQQLLPA